jgi:hypothetical protein
MEHKSMELAAAVWLFGVGLVSGWAGPNLWGFKFPFFLSETKLKTKSKDTSNSLYFNKTPNVFFVHRICGNLYIFSINSMRQT